MLFPVLYRLREITRSRKGKYITRPLCMCLTNPVAFCHLSFAFLTLYRRGSGCFSCHYVIQSFKILPCTKGVPSAFPVIMTAGGGISNPVLKGVDFPLCCTLSVISPSNPSFFNPVLKGFQVLFLTFSQRMC